MVKPLGIQPEKYWLLDRAKELARVINETLSQDYEGTINIEQLVIWINELKNVLCKLPIERNSI